MEPLPLLKPRHLQEAGEPIARLLAIELARELSPLAALLAMAWGLRRRPREVAAFFMLGFGIWDISYYAFLKLLLDWPASLTTWDILYLIPTAWVAPVWAPLVVSVTLVAGGLAILLSSGRLRPLWGRLVPACLLIVGTGVVLTSFFLRTAESFGAVPERFDWQWFLGGWLAAVAGLVWLLWPAGPEGC
ncbi:MAG: hypothetical protein ACYTF6_02115 [Planctomycetota bacterium]